MVIQIPHVWYATNGCTFILNKVYYILHYACLHCNIFKQPGENICSLKNVFLFLVELLVDVVTVELLALPGLT